MNKTFCDRCGAVIKERMSLRWNYVRLFFDDNLDKYYDICPRCYREIKEFVERPEEFYQRVYEIKEAKICQKSPL